MWSAAPSVSPLTFVKLLLEYAGEIQIATPEQIEVVRREYDHACRMIPKANVAGVRLLVGDDYGVLALPHGSYASELEFYVKELGVAPLDVLRWATRNGAEAMGRATAGRWRAGKLADLVSSTAIVGGHRRAEGRREDPSGSGRPLRARQLAS